ncbi:L-carnitine dehydratase/bile acid-inducible protein F [Novosphingobium aromaticivorans DSM 12444]|uniref:L-carnitine dehydratase/bile acid-inducible protein F n=1 Tax=Novosphingobium aromaticivorans (strain ATCC 700278 / DSM 12444 / CCUG 56034 / CIP 105152 / NBRC 16084 / F199) TaxID=279238 RepID=Q2G905_NOVAD|nr:CoA transferase [Novosphingobium aromaticivorans]ABD25668.1 L-carnitine dehydratase/bile acid-inducible protein F [Novosphingobium aromaticivorans DSM 12444]SCY00068.1 2-methylfumaryl-CoA isomerase [Novosphingobium aromaticivorans]
MYQLLNGLSIVEVSSFVASPTAGLYCAQMGAEVIRIDDSRGGLDYKRYMMTREGRSLSWENLNRAKKSVALDLQSAEGRELAVQLAQKTGQVITNLPLESFMAHERIAAGRPDLVSVRIMGWHDGRQAMDFTVNAASGYPLMTGPEEWDPKDAPPVNQILPAWDFITGAYCAFALLAGLRHRDATGQGSELRVPLGDVAIGTAFNAGAAPEMLYRDGDRERIGNAIWGAFGRDFRSRDGHRFMVAALTPKQWKATVEAFDLAEAVAALEAELGVSFLASDHWRFVHRHRLFDLFQQAAEGFDYADLSQRMTRAGATFERYRTMHEMARDPDLVTSNPLFGPSPANPSGFEYPAPRSFANIPDREAGDPMPAPYLGQHSEEVLAERLGLSSGQIATLIDRGVVARSDKDQ